LKRRTEPEHFFVDYSVRYSIRLAAAKIESYIYSDIDAMLHRYAQNTKHPRAASELLLGNDHSRLLDIRQISDGKVKKLWEKSSA